MKLVIISDVHIKKSDDEADQLLMSFFNHPDVQNSDGIFLLGDIFDLMIGPHSQYYTRFSNYFDNLKELLKKGKKIYYVPGNHDFHLEQLYKNFFKYNPELDSNLFQLSDHFIIEDKHRKIYLAHGDDIEIDNLGYKVFKSIVNSFPLKFCANNLIPHFLMKSIGEYSSRQSRKRNIKRYSNEFDLPQVREKFRESARRLVLKQPLDIVVCGHSHVKDDYVSSKGFRYINNGFALHTKTFISIVDGNAEFKSLS